MNANLVLSIAALTLGCATLRAQTAPPPPPPAAVNYGYGTYGGNLNSDVALAASVTATYATHWDAPGVSAELGGLWNTGPFFGGEISSYQGDSKGYNVYRGGAFVGHFRSRQEITTLDAAYRYFL